jgi:hypothetical protein
MVIRGKTRGNGQQLGHYLITMGENDHIHILEVNGRLHANDDYLLQTMKQMALTSELAKGAKGFHHAEINPAYGEDRNMSFDDWLQAADILGAELQLEEQRRIIVLHEKKGRIHAHVAWERYDHKQGKMVSDSFSRLAQDRARKKMELVFEQTPTPHRNKNRPEVKAALTQFWQQTETGAEFIKTVSDNGYMIAAGVLDRPFMVVDENGRTFDLVRQLKGVRTKDVRQRLRNEKLVPEKEAIVLMRNKKKTDSGSSKSDQQKADIKRTAKQTASAFADNRKDATHSDIAANDNKQQNKAAPDIENNKETDQRQEKKKDLAGLFASNRPDLTKSQEAADHEDDLEPTDQQKKENIARAFAQNRNTDGTTLTEEEEIQKLIQEQRDIRERNKYKKKMRF